MPKTKQVSLLTASGVPVAKELVLQGGDYYYRSSVGGIGQKMKVGVFVQFDNREASRLGLCHAIVPHMGGHIPKLGGMALHEVRRLSQAMSHL